MEPHTSLNSLDYIVLGVVVLSGLLALMRGFVREIFSLGSWTGAYFMAAKLYPLAEPWVHRYIKNPTVVTAVAAFAIFLVTLVILTILSSLVAGFIRGKALTSIDRSLGFLFGLARGALVASLVYMGAVSILWPDLNKDRKEQVQEQATTGDKEAKAAPDWLMQARTRPAMAYGASLLKTLVPQEEIEKSAQKFTQKLLDKKDETQHEIEQKTLDSLSTPAVSGAKDNKAPSYDDKSRSGIDNLINQKAAP